CCSYSCRASLSSVAGTRGTSVSPVIAVSSVCVSAEIACIYDARANIVDGHQAAHESGRPSSRYNRGTGGGRRLEVSHGEQHSRLSGPGHGSRSRQRGGDGAERETGP